MTGGFEAFWVAHLRALRTAGFTVIRSSSPRVRGTRKIPAGFVAVRRFIPARAGNTGFRQGKSERAAVHPRACGEHVV